LLVVWLLAMIAYIFSIVVYIYYYDQNFEIYYAELYLLRSYFVLLWIVNITFIHAKQFNAKRQYKLLIFFII